MVYDCSRVNVDNKGSHRGIMDAHDAQRFDAVLVRLEAVSPQAPTIDFGLTVVTYASQIITLISVSLQHSTKSCMAPQKKPTATCKAVKRKVYADHSARLSPVPRAVANMHCIQASVYLTVCYRT